MFALQHMLSLSSVRDEKGPLLMLGKGKQMRTISKPLGQNCPGELLGNRSFGVLPGEGDMGLGEGVEGDGEKGVFKV